MNWYDQISKISKGVFILTPPHFYSYLFAGKDLAIVDTGPGVMIPWVPPVYPIILNSIKLFNFDRTLVKWILITEPHPDHIGGLKNLLDALPNSTVITSKRNVDELGENFKERCKIVEKDDEIDLGEERIKVLETPGHSEGEISFYKVNDGALACADTCGFLYLREKKIMIPAPHYNFRAVIDSIQQIRKLKPKILLTGHNGAMTGSAIEEYLDNSEKAIQKWEKEIKINLEQPRTMDQLNEILIKKFSEMSLCPNPHQTSMITEAMTRVLKSEGKIIDKTEKGKIFWKSVSTN